MPTIDYFESILKSLVQELLSIIYSILLDNVDLIDNTNAQGDRKLNEEIPLLTWEHMKLFWSQTFIHVCKRIFSEFNIDGFILLLDCLLRFLKDLIYSEMFCTQSFLFHIWWDGSVIVGLYFRHYSMEKLCK